METSTRREFISENSMVSVIGGLGAFSAASWENKLNRKFIHHVFFWLKEPAKSSARKKLVDGLQQLASVKTIRMSQIGMPAATSREVIDGSYSVSWLLVFDNAADQDSYQTDPIHLRFIDECSSLWKKVMVYDSIDYKSH